MLDQPIADSMASLMQADGVPTDDFVARQLQSVLIDRAALIITATLDHRSTVVRMRPDAISRCFTLVELAESLPLFNLAETLNMPAGARLPHFMEAVRFARPRLRLSPEQSNIIDPFGHSSATYLKAYQRIRQCVSALAPVLSQMLGPGSR